MIGNLYWVLWEDSGLHCVIFLAYTFFFFFFFENNRLWLISLCDYVTLLNLPYHMIAYDIKTDTSIKMNEKF